MDGLLGVAGMIITSDEMDHSRKFPAKPKHQPVIEVSDPQAASTAKHLLSLQVANSWLPGLPVATDRSLRLSW